MIETPTEIDSAVPPPVEEETETRQGHQITYWQMVWLRFQRNRLAFVGLIALVLIYIATLGAEFVAPYGAQTRFLDAITVPPQLPRFVDVNGKFHLQPYIYEIKMERDIRTFKRTYTFDFTKPHPIQLFVHGEEYRLLFWTLDIHLFGVEGVPLFLLGTDLQGRDLFSRILYGGRISTTIGLIGVALSLILGITIGMASGFIGGTFDQIVQRSIEVILSFPSVPLWLALSAVLPKDWSPLRVFFAITIILSFIGWGGLARIVRGMTLALQGEEYVLAAQMSGGGRWWIIIRHLLPANFSYIIVAATLAVPSMILGETALSFLGLGLRPPIVSWGVLLQDAQDVTNIGQSTWLILPVVPLILTVLAFNFVGDGLRDAIDPYSRY